MDEALQHWDSRTNPMPAATVEVPYRRFFNAPEVAQLRHGLIPQQMDDKWFGILRADSLDFYRSWTGNHIFRLPVRPEGDGLLTDSLVVNNDPDQHRRRGDGADIEMVQLLTAHMLAGAPA